MNILEARVVLRDRSVFDVLDLAIRFLVEHGRAYAKCALVVLPPAYLATYLSARFLGWGWAWTFAFVLGPFVCAPFTSLASRLLFDEAARVRDVLRASIAALPRLVALRIFEGVLTATIVGAFWGVPVCFFANEVVVLERASVGRAIARLQRLLGGDVILAVLFLTALHIVVTFAGDAVGRGVLEDLLEVTAPPSMWSTNGSGLGLAAYWLFMPYLATARFLLYINVRTRTEGWDVQTRFAALAARAGDEAA